MSRLRSIARPLCAAPWRQAMCVCLLAGLAFVLSGVLGTTPAHAILGIDVGDVVDEALDKVLDLLFADVPRVVSVDIVGWLVALDNPMAADHRALQRIEGATSAAAWGMLGLLVTLAVFRYWLAGLGGNGTFEAIQGIWRGAAAAAMLVLWPYVVSNSVLLVNNLTHGLLSETVKRNTASLVGDALGPADGASLFIVRLVAGLVGVLLSIALFCMKVMLTASLDVLFACAPLAIALWVLPETGWLAKFVSRTFVALLLWPIVWVVCFAVFGAIGVETLTPKGSAAELIKPFVAIALLYLCLKLPFVILSAASVLDGPGGGFVGGTARYVVSRTIYDRVSGRGGGQRAPATDPAAGAGPGGGGQGGGGQAGSGPRRPQGGGGAPQAPNGGQPRASGAAAMPSAQAASAPGATGALAAGATALSSAPAAARTAAQSTEGRPSASRIGTTQQPQSQPARGDSSPPPLRPQRPAVNASAAAGPATSSERAASPPRPTPAPSPSRDGDAEPMRTVSAASNATEPPVASAASPISGNHPSSALSAGEPGVSPGEDRSPKPQPPAPGAPARQARASQRTLSEPPRSRRQPSFLA